VSAVRPPGTVHWRSGVPLPDASAPLSNGEVNSGHDGLKCARREVEPFGQGIQPCARVRGCPGSKRSPENPLDGRTLEIVISKERRQIGVRFNSE
jgi:hypothetical protein